MDGLMELILCFKSKKVTGDYHDEMTSQHFEEPDIPSNSLIMHHITVRD